MKLLLLEKVLSVHIVTPMYWDLYWGSGNVELKKYNLNSKYNVLLQVALIRHFWKFNVVYISNEVSG